MTHAGHLEVIHIYNQKVKVRSQLRWHDLASIKHAL